MTYPIVSLTCFFLFFSSYPWAGILRKVHLQVQIELCSTPRMLRHAFLLDRPVQHYLFLFSHSHCSSKSVARLTPFPFVVVHLEFGQSLRGLSFRWSVLLSSLVAAASQATGVVWRRRAWMGISSLQLSIRSCSYSGGWKDCWVL
jgi:hypothetical protein